MSNQTNAWIDGVTDTKAELDRLFFEQYWKSGNMPYPKLVADALRVIARDFDQFAYEIAENEGEVA